MGKLSDKLLLKPEDFESSLRGMEVEGVFNPAAIRLPNGDIMLYVRVAEGPIKRKHLGSPMIVSKDQSHYKYRLNRRLKREILEKKGNVLYLRDGVCRLLNLSHLRKVILDKNGFNIKKIYQKPFFTGMPHDGNLGVEDPRLTKIGRKYLMTYVAVSSYEGASTALAISKNLKSWKREGIIFREQNKDVVIFPEKINGMYVALHRPEGFFSFSKPSIWISYSKDLTFWGEDKSIVHPRRNSWDERRIGSGCPPIKTNEGWLEIYHGIGGRGERGVYSAGAFLMDLKNPEKILARTPKTEPLMKPGKKYERKGFINNVVFPTGIVRDLNDKDLLIYSGGADSIISVRRMSIKHILNSMTHHSG
ncbi:glycosidase [Candidatus Pacearchaeota archaeon]|nr:glycosidase [Candidatus Pacearchaeota archaeon]